MKDLMDYLLTATPYTRFDLITVIWGGMAIERYGPWKGFWVFMALVMVSTVLEILWARSR